MDFSSEQRFTTKKAGGIGVAVVAHVLLAGAIVYGLQTTTRPHVEQPPVKVLPDDPVIKHDESIPTKEISKRDVLIDKILPPVDEQKLTDKTKVDTGPKEGTPPGTTEKGGSDTQIGDGGGSTVGGAGKALPHTSSPVISDFESCKPVYTRTQILNEEEGTVRLRMEIGADGKMIGANVLKSSSYGDLDRSTLNALSKCSFKPAMQDGSPVQSSLVIDYSWSLAR